MGERIVLHANMSASFHLFTVLRPRRAASNRCRLRRPRRPLRVPTLFARHGAPTTDSTKARLQGIDRRTLRLSRNRRVRVGSGPTVGGPRKQPARVPNGETDSPAAKKPARSCPPGPSRGVPRTVYASARQFKPGLAVALAAMSKIVWRREPPGPGSPPRMPGARIAMSFSTRRALARLACGDVSAWQRDAARERSPGDVYSQNGRSRHEQPLASIGRWSSSERLGTLSHASFQLSRGCRGPWGGCGARPSVFDAAARTSSCRCGPRRAIRGPLIAAHLYGGGGGRRAAAGSAATARPATDGGGGGSTAAATATAAAATARSASDGLGGGRRARRRRRRRRRRRPGSTKRRHAGAGGDGGDARARLCTHSCARVSAAVSPRPRDHLRHVEVGLLVRCPPPVAPLPTSTPLTASCAPAFEPHMITQSVSGVTWLASGVFQ